MGERDFCIRLKKRIKFFSSTVIRDFNEFRPAKFGQYPLGDLAIPIQNRGRGKRTEHIVANKCFDKVLKEGLNTEVTTEVIGPKMFPDGTEGLHRFDSPQPKACDYGRARTGRSHALNIFATDCHMGKLKCVDLFCGGGGASMGYFRAGFDVVGIDLHPQPEYPFEFVQQDALSVDLSPYDLVVASPPCQKYSNSWARSKHSHKDYPDLIDATRMYIESFNKPYVIENVQGAGKELSEPVKLCGTMFGLKVFRHRLFEFGGGLTPPEVEMQCKHRGLRAVSPYYKDGNMWTVCGTGGGWGSITEWKHAMGIDWLSRKKPMAQAIPPAYTEWVGVRARQQLEKNICSTNKSNASSESTCEENNQTSQ